ncbi:zinc ribbon domain-containing protein [Nocardia sp. NPDC058114]|uniref:zinc ribbon domain-containing protein n=1 Tax=Nocardia sp. NPDC058114 TaxID=3346346 RepID=UPI0036DD0428
MGRLRPTFDLQQAWRSGTVATADRWYPSSKRCSACATINPALKLADRVFICGCGFRADRDHNGDQPCLLAHDSPRRSTIPGPPSKRPGYRSPPTGRR